MPRKRTSVRKKQDQTVPDWQINYLLYGTETPSLEFHFGWNPLEVWQGIREEVLPMWLKDHPGTRPAAWWDFEAPKDHRRQVGGSGYPDADSTLLKGIPSEWYGVDHSDLPQIESQATFLKRHGLLSKAELSRLTDDDFLPETLDREFLGIDDD